MATKNGKNVPAPPVSIRVDDDDDEFPLSTRLFTEFIGTVILVYIVSLSATQGEVLSTAITAGFTLFCIINMFLHISGGHVNPAVTLALCMMRKIGPMEAMLYVIAQMMGAFFAGTMLYLTLPPNVLEDMGAASSPHMVIVSSEQHRIFAICQATLIEAILTFLLILTVLLVLIDRVNHLGLLCIGFVLIANIIAGAHCTGAYMNPAFVFGTTLATYLFSSAEWEDLWTYHPIYWIGPPVGSACATMLYRALFAKNRLFGR